MDFPQQGIGRLARPDDQDRLSAQLGRTVETVLLPASIGKPRSAHDDGKKKRVQNQHRTRNQRHLEDGDHGRGQQGTNEDRAAQMLQVGNAGKAPKPLVQPEKIKQDGEQR